MTDEEFIEFINLEKQCIEESKWYASEKAKRDLEKEGYDEEWIKNHAENFRIMYEKSCCKKCKKIKDCKNIFKVTCESIENKNC